MGPRRLLVLIFPALVATIVAVEVPTAGQETIDGDAEAWREVVASYRRLTDLKSYRMRYSGTPILTFPLTVQPYTVEVVNPDRFHVVFELGQEYVIVGNETRARFSRSGPLSSWLCLPSTRTVTIRTETGEFRDIRVGSILTSGLLTLSPPVPELVALIMGKSKATMSAVTISRLDDRILEGKKARGYNYWVTVSGPTGLSRGVRERLFVLAESGLPSRIEVLFDTDRLLKTVDFSDYDTPINITVPRCE